MAERRAQQQGSEQAAADAAVETEDVAAGNQTQFASSGRLPSVSGPADASPTASERGYGGADVEADRHGIPGELAEQLGRKPEVRSMYHELSREARAELDRAFTAYSERVHQRTAEGWSHGGVKAIGNFGSGMANDPFVGRFTTGNDRAERAHGEVGESFSSLEQQHQALAAERSRLLAQLQTDPDNAHARQRLATVEHDLGQRSLEMQANFGRCGDWAAEVRDLLSQLGLQHFIVQQVTTSSGGHTAVRLTPEGCRGAFVFDPWKTGRPDVASFAQWDH